MSEQRIEVDCIWCLDDGPPLGYYAKGEHDPAAFFAEVVREWGHHPSEAGLEYVRQVWWRNVPIRDPLSGCSHRFVEAEPHARGAYLVTKLDVGRARRDRAAARRAALTPTPAQEPSDGR